MGGRVAMRPSPTALPKCLRARGVHTVLSERGIAAMLLPCSQAASGRPCSPAQGRRPSRFFGVSGLPPLTISPSYHRVGPRDLEALCAPKSPHHAATALGREGTTCTNCVV